MDGLLAAADFGEEGHVDLWFLADYGAERWERRHRVAARVWPTKTPYEISLSAFLLSI
jgi:hypothetical protein